MLHRHALHGLGMQRFAKKLATQFEQGQLVASSPDMRRVVNAEGLATINAGR